MLDVSGGLLDTTKQWHMTVSGAILLLFLMLDEAHRMEQFEWGGGQKE